ncbi:hypothetical protein ACWCQ8_48525, partial [Streptomyces mirabilis]
MRDRLHSGSACGSTPPRVRRYALAFAAGLITGGRLGDIHGRKRLFLVGIGGFTIASALCGFAANPEMLASTETTLSSPAEPPQGPAAVADRRRWFALAIV